MKRERQRDCSSSQTNVQQKSKQQTPKLSRKEMRKNARREKKARKNAYYTKQKVAVTDQSAIEELPEQPTLLIKAEKKTKKRKNVENENSQFKRKAMLLEDNKREEKYIHTLEKQLKLHKRKSKSIPLSFVSDGLDYILDVCEADKIPHLIEQEMSDVDADFEDDFAIATNTSQPNNKSSQAPGTIKQMISKVDTVSQQKDSVNEESRDDEEPEEETLHFDEEVSLESKGNLVKAPSDEDTSVEDEDDFNEENDDTNGTCEFHESAKDEKAVVEKWNKQKSDKYWEDIYGRLRDKEGNVIEEKGKHSGSYLPPALRPSTSSTDTEKTKLLQRLKRQVKGLLNRLSESNIKPISNQIEELYMQNARNDMNESLTQLMLEAIVHFAPTPEKLIQEHALLVTLLHANIGPEIGARFVEVLVDKFKALHMQGGNYGEGKQCDNLVHLLIHLYSFKVFNSVIIYDLLQLFADSFSEKDIDLILLVLRSVGFTLRKDDPLNLKNVILKLQSQAAGLPNSQDKPRVRFMLDTLMALRNNNMHKIPNYDPSHIEHLKKLLRSFIRKGNSVTELKITLSDLLNVESRGRWWIVGSAWAGQPVQQLEKQDEDQKNVPIIENASDSILELARKQRMNTDIRKTIFCIVMTAEDYIDAFEKLLRLNLNAQQERDIINVSLECCLQEKIFNPYYAFLLLRFCNKDRKYQIMIQFAIWDKIKQLKEATLVHSSNLAQLLAHLFLNKALTISALKVIDFGEMDKVLVRFLRQILLKVLLHDPEQDVQEMFSKAAKSDKLHVFREGLILFMHHFLLKNKSKMPPKAHEKLEQRIKTVENILNNLDITKTRF